jgi:hypothetical protein
MKKPKDREPDLIEYRLEYFMNDDLPSERFFMATCPRDALSQLAYSCIKHIPIDNLSEQEQDGFAKSFSNPSSPFIEEPKLLPVPDAIADIDFPEPEPEPQIQEELNNIEENNGLQNEGDFSDSTNESIPTPPLEHKPDPAIEHQNKQMERLNEISEIQIKNQKLMEEYENLCAKVRKIMEWFCPRITVQTFEEHNRWSDSWAAIDYPLVSEKEDENNE